MTKQDVKRNRNLNFFEAAYPDIAAWWADNPFEFAVSLRNQVIRSGLLTEKQIAAAQKCAQRHKEKLETAKAFLGEEFDTKKLQRAMDNARSRGSKAPKIRVMLLLDEVHECTVEFKAKAYSDDTFYVTVNGDFQGSLEGVRLVRRVETCDSFEVGVIKDALADLEEAALRYGRVTGSCSCCGRELTNPESIALSIGPICREKFFL